MPWIAVTTSPLPSSITADRLAADVARAAAAALTLEPGDVIVLVSPAQGSNAAGAHIHLAGRARPAEAEARLAADVSAVVAEALGISADVVGVTRAPG